MAVGSHLHAASLNVLYSFITSNPGGSNPQAALVQGSDGNFYGTSAGNGSGNNGTVYKITPAGVLTTLVTFTGANGANPSAALVQGSDGNFYGTTEAGGSSGDGTVFVMTPAGALTTLVSFTGANGANPYAGLAQGRDGNFYGTTEAGGSSGDGSVFKMTPAGVLTTLVSFYGANGANPYAALVQDGNGNFYGTTKAGGSSNDGTIFAVTPAGVLNTLVSFGGADGANPYAGLVRGRDGSFYGTTSGGGTLGHGVAFQLIVPQAAAPVFSPVAGTYTSAQVVTITSATSGTSIRYTTDGSTPSETNGTLYTGNPVTINSTTTLKAIAYEPGFADSPVTSGTYTINVLLPSISQITSFTSLYGFMGNADGAYPDGALLKGIDGRLYGTAFQGGVNGVGTAFAIQPDGTGFITLHSFTGGNDGANPFASLIQGSDGRLYGTSQGGAKGFGTVFAMNSDGTGFTTLYSFTNSNDGAYSSAHLIQGADGRLYGTTTGDGIQDFGSVFAIGTDGTGFVTLYSFTNGSDGSSPGASLMQGPDGRLYGTAAGGGANGDGTLFSIAINPDGTASFAILYSFTGSNDGAYPCANLMQGSDGRLYGTASGGGANGDGTLFAITINPDGTVSLAALYSFTGGGDGANPNAGLIQGGDGRLYGTAAGGGANGDGTVFAVNPDGTNFTMLYSFTDGNDGANPQASLIRGNDGGLYGTASGGGASGNGTLFAISSLSNQSVIAGNDVAFTATVAGALPLSCQWQFNGVNITGATGATLILPNVSTSNAGSYTVVVSNAAGSVMSAATTLTVTAPVIITFITTHGQPGPQGLVSVLVTQVDGATPVANQPVTLAVTTGASQISATPGGPWAAPGSVTVLSNASGVAQAYINFTTTSSFEVLLATAQSAGQISSISTNLYPGPPIYATGFEASEGYTLGSLDNQQGWGVPQGVALVTNNDAFSGSQSVILQPGATPAQIAQAIPVPAAENIVYVDFYAKPVTGTNPPGDINATTTFDIGGASFKLNTVYTALSDPETINVFNGDGQGGGNWISTNFSLEFSPPADWIRLTVRLDYTHKTWDLYANGKMIAADLGLQDATSTYLSSFTVTGDATIATELDCLGVETFNPLFADINGDGIDDPWETAHGLSLSVDDSELDLTGNGLTVVQDYVNGTDPNDFFNGQPPVVTLVNQGGQLGAQGLVSVTVANSSGVPLANSSVTFTLSAAGNLISATPGGTAAAQVTVTTNSSGVAQAYVDYASSSATDTLTVTLPDSGQTAADSTTNLAVANPALPVLQAEVVQFNATQYGFPAFSSSLIDSMNYAMNNSPFPGTYLRGGWWDVPLGYDSSLLPALPQGGMDLYLTDTHTEAYTYAVGLSGTLVQVVNMPGMNLPPQFSQTMTGLLLGEIARGGMMIYDAPTTIEFPPDLPGFLTEYSSDTLSDPYTAAQFLADAQNRLPAFTGNFSPVSSISLNYNTSASWATFDFPDYLNTLLGNLAAKEDVSACSTQFQFVWNSAANLPDPKTVAWVTEFTPQTPAGQPPATPTFTLSSWTGSGTQSPVQTFTPPSGQYGTYQIIPIPDNLTIQSYLNKVDSNGNAAMLANAQPVCVGEPITLSFNLPSSIASQANVSYQWTLPQEALKNFDPTLSSGQVTPITSYLNAQNVTFYMPVVPSNNAVSCQITVNGASVTFTGTLTVVTPTVNVIGIPQEGIVLAPPSSSAPFWDLECGEAHPGSDGMTFNAGNLVPPPNFNLLSPGSTNWLQVLKTDVVNYVKNGTPKSLLNNGTLDETVTGMWSYNGYADKTDGSGTKPLPSDDVNDPPNDSPDSEITNPPITELDRTFVANMYYMWKPNIPAANGMPAAIWVPLEEITWSLDYKTYCPDTTQPDFQLDTTFSQPITDNPPTIQSMSPTGEPSWNGIANYQSFP